MARVPRQVVTQARTRVVEKAKDTVPEGQGFVASPTPAGGNAPASVHQAQNGSEGSGASSAEGHSQEARQVLLDRADAFLAKTDLSFSHCLKNGGWGLDGTLFLGTTFGTPDRSIPGQERLRVNNGRL